MVPASVLAVLGLGGSSAARAAACTGVRVPFAYPIVLKGPPSLFGTRVTNLSAWVWRDGKWGEAPVQVEEVNHRGDYVLDGGLPFTKDSDDGLFDANDEVVLDGAELGDDFRPEEVPPEVAAGVVQSWKVSFCRGDASSGHLLLQSRHRPKPWTGTAAVRFDQAKAEIETSAYRYVFNPKSPALLGEVRFRGAGGERGVIRNSKFMMPLKTPFWMPDLTFRDDDFTSAVESWQSGPVRTIVAVGVKYSAFLSLFKLHLFSELVFYRNRFVIPTVIEFIFDPSSHLKPGSGVAYSLSFPEGRGWQIDGNLTPLPAESPDAVVGSGKTAAATETFVARGHGPDGAFLAQVRVDAKARAMVPPPFLIRAEQFQSEAHQKHWPWLKDLPGDLGVFLDFSRVHRGIYDFGLDLILAPKADETFTDYGPVDTSWQHLPPRK